MTNNRSMRNTILTALLAGFMAAAAVGGCAGMSDEASGEHGAEGEGEGEGEGEESRTLLALDQTLDMVRNGGRLIMRYDADANAFVGTVQNITGGTLPRARVEVHLSNGIELGPTPPVDLAPDEMIEVTLKAPTTAFTGWTAHAESGPGHGAGGEGGGEHGSGGERGEHGSARESRGEHGG